MIQTTIINGHTYYIVDARTITPRKMVAQEINLMLNHCKKTRNTYNIRCIRQSVYNAARAIH